MITVIAKILTIDPLIPLIAFGLEDLKSKYLKNNFLVKIVYNKIYHMTDLSFENLTPNNFKFLY